MMLNIRNCMCVQNYKISDTYHLRSLHWIWEFSVHLSLLGYLIVCTKTRDLLVNMQNTKYCRILRKGDLKALTHLTSKTYNLRCLEILLVFKMLFNAVAKLVRYHLRIKQYLELYFCLFEYWHQSDTTGCPVN